MTLFGRGILEDVLFSAELIHHLVNLIFHAGAYNFCAWMQGIIVRLNRCRHDWRVPFTGRCFVAR